ncbi:MAG: hypothetical protein Q9224_004717, partial [Gallowayella concinna]
ILWSWIDLDTKRLEPYFQLSKPGGAALANSLELQYPFDFVAYAPLKALRRRHWAVVFAGTSMMAIFWGVTPLISSVFTRSIVMQEIHGTAKTTATLMPLKGQSPAMNTDFMMTAYGIAWLGQELPGFVTNQGALEPFEIDSSQTMDFLNTTWKAQTKLYGTSLDCQAAVIANREEGGFSISNGKDCTIPPGNVNLAPKSQFGGLYIGYYTDQHSDYSLEGLECPSSANAHLFLALWGEDTSQSSNGSLTGLFCEPSYWIQDVNATVTVPSMNVSDVVPLGPRTSLLDSLFNRTAFEYDIGTGAQSVSQRADISETTSIINQNANLEELDFDGTATNMVGFALGLSRLAPVQYAEPHNLASSFEKAHKLLHALAIRQLTVTKTKNDGGGSGTVFGKTNAIVVVRPLAIAVEVLLGLVVALILALTFHSFKRISQLCKDPASLTDLVVMMAKSPSPNGLPSKDDDQLAASKSVLVAGKLTTPRFNKASCADATKTAGDKGGSCAPRTAPIAPLVRPLEMRVTVAMVFISLLVSTLIALIVLKYYAGTKIGLPLPSKSTVVNQLVLNYLLIILATFLEPFWLLLNRQLCVLQPFVELRQANAPAWKSLDLKYTSLPPQMNIWKALRAHHYLLSVVCAIGLSANLLAVSISGLLQVDLVPMEFSRNFTRQQESRYTRISYRQDVWNYQYVAKANFSDGVALPPWTAPDKFFVPLGVESTLAPGNFVRASTQGFGIRPICERSVANDTAIVKNQPNVFVTEQRTPSGKIVQCGASPGAFGGQNNVRAALEILIQLEPVVIKATNAVGSNAYGGNIGDVAVNATAEETLTCNQIILVGFLRANLTVAFDDRKTDNTIVSNTPEIAKINALSSLWMTCRSTLVTAPYDVTVDGSGRVLAYSTEDINAENSPNLFSNGTTPASLVTTATKVLTHGANTGPYWHDDNFTDTWFGYFVKHLSNSTMFVDPAKPVPSFESVVPYVEDIWTRLFAIVLGLNQDWLAKAEGGAETPGIVIVPTQRVFVSGRMFVITVTLFTLNIVVALAYWLRRPKKMLTEMPYTIGNILEMVRASGLIFEVEDQERWQHNWRFGYGKFVGTDGRPHVGIERSPFVIPLDR